MSAWGNDPSRPVDLTDLDRWVDGIPRERFAWLRANEPVSWHEDIAPNHGFWSVTRHADIVALSKDWRTWTSTEGVSFEECEADEMEARRTLIDTDPPRHSRLRQLVGPGFTAKSIAGYEPFVRELAVDALQRALPLGEFDAIEHIAKDVPIRVLARIMGLPDDRLDVLVDLGDRLIANTDPEITDVVWGRDDTDEYRMFPFRSPYGKQLWELGHALAQERRACPAHDLVNTLIEAEIDGERLSSVEFDNFFSLLVIAGNETTRIAIAQGLLALMEHPAQWDRLKADPSLVASATEEILRWSCPTHFMRRTAVVDVELGGHTIRAGDKVILWYVSGNFDEAVFADPQRFDVGRSPNDHLTFGKGGPHFCLGAHLARQEVRVVLEELVARVDRLELCGPPARIRSNFTNGLKRLAVRAILPD